MKSTARIGTHPIHPMLVAFPIGLWVTSFVFDVIGGLLDHDGLHVAAYYMAVAGCIGALAAALPGLIDLLTVIPGGTPTRRTGWIHALLNVAALALFAASVWLRPWPGAMNYPAYLTAAVAVLVLGYSGWLGGSLVYDDKVGVPAEPAPR
ncbi:MAG: DUF2231 domain-containing protein [Gemmatimonadaceae bacterium]